jgi:hypothetical protein
MIQSAGRRAGDRMDLRSVIDTILCDIWKFVSDLRQVGGFLSVQ